MEDSKRMQFLGKRGPVTLRQAAARAVLQLPTSTGISKVYASQRKETTTTILMYHSVARGEVAKWILPGNIHTPREFESQLSFLARKRNVVSLTEMVAAHLAGERFKPGTVVMTFDDGYLDNLEVVAPLLKKYDLPATFFLASGFMEQQCNGWWDEIYTFFRTRFHNQLTLELRNVRQHWDLGGCEGERDAFEAISWFCMDADVEEREKVVNEIRRQLAPLGEAPRLMMTWDDVRTLVREYPRVEIGAHTVNHLNLAANLVKAKGEVLTSVSRIEEEAKIKVKFLACPYNRQSPGLIDLLEQLPLNAVVADNERNPVVRSGKTNSVSLPRLGAPYRTSNLRDWTSGAYPDLQMKLFGRCWNRPQ